MIMEHTLGKVTNEIVHIFFKNLQKEKNKEKIKIIFQIIIQLALQNIRAYLYVIMTMLVIIFLINCFQFYYYIKHYTILK